MKISSADFLTSETDIRKIPNLDGKLEIVLIGKSNVGKSSFINSFCGRKGLARISQNPGRTRTANVYEINGVFLFVDMPGYGYAKVSKAERERFAKIIFDYLRKRREDFIVYLLIDGRHMPTELDKEMAASIGREGITPVILFTKMDKIPKSEWKAQTAKILKELGREGSEGSLLFSVHNAQLIEEARDFTESLIAPEA